MACLLLQVTLAILAMFALEEVHSLRKQRQMKNDVFNESDETLALAYNGSYPPLSSAETGGNSLLNEVGPLRGMPLLNNSRPIPASALDVTELEEASNQDLRSRDAKPVKTKKRKCLPKRYSTIVGVVVGLIVGCGIAAIAGFKFRPKPAGAWVRASQIPVPSEEDTLATPASQRSEVPPPLWGAPLPYQQPSPEDPPVPEPLHWTHAPTAEDDSFSHAQTDLARSSVAPTEAAGWTPRWITYFVLFGLSALVTCACIGGFLGLYVGSHINRTVSFQCQSGTKPPEHGFDCSLSSKLQEACLPVLEAPAETTRTLTTTIASSTTIETTSPTSTSTSTTSPSTSTTTITTTFSTSTSVTTTAATSTTTTTPTTTTTSATTITTSSSNPLASTTTTSTTISTTSKRETTTTTATTTITTTATTTATTTTSTTIPTTSITSTTTITSSTSTSTSTTLTATTTTTTTKMTTTTTKSTTITSSTTPRTSTTSTTTSLVKTTTVTTTTTTEKPSTTTGELTTTSTTTGTVVSAQGSGGEISDVIDVGGPPTDEEYMKFQDVLNFEQDLHEIVAIGKKVAHYFDDPIWIPTVYSLKSFLHDRKKSKLREKMQLPAYNKHKLAGMKIGVMGAGPSGLRFAIEAALHGATVHLVEKRSKFNRFNVLKLWSFTVEDIESLGGKLLFPKLKSFSVRRIPIAVLQHLLLRVALALGVQFHPECAVETLVHADASLRVDSRYSCPSRSQWEHVDFDAILDGTGTIAVLRDSVDTDGDPLIDSKAEGKEMLGMTMNFKRFAKAETNGDLTEKEYYDNTKGDPRFEKYNPAKADDSNLSNQFARALFANKRITIDNWVYWKSDSSHYIVITIPRQTLIDEGVAPESAGSASTSDFLRSIDKSKLVGLGLELAEEWNFPHASKDASAFVVNFAGKPDLAVFDFGITKKAEHPCRFLPGKQPGKRVYVGVIGDAVKTPFWPYGTGANHAFYSAHLQTWAILAWKGYDYDEEDTSKLADNMMKATRAMKIEGNALDFNKNSYLNLVANNYLAVAQRKTLKFE